MYAFLSSGDVFFQNHFFFHKNLASPTYYPSDVLIKSACSRNDLVPFLITISCNFGLNWQSHEIVLHNGPFFINFLKLVINFLKYTLRSENF